MPEINQQGTLEKPKKFERKKFERSGKCLKGEILQLKGKNKSLQDHLSLRKLHTEKETLQLHSSRAPSSSCVCASA